MEFLARSITKNMRPSTGANLSNFVGFRNENLCRVTIVKQTLKIPLLLLLILPFPKGDQPFSQLDQ